MIKKTRLRIGFTLLELVIAIAIIGLIASVAIPAYKKYILKSKTSEAYVMLRKMYDGALIYGSQWEIVGYNGGQQHSCQKITLFGSFISAIIHDDDPYYIPPKNGIKSKISFDKHSLVASVRIHGDGKCWYRNYKTNPALFGFDVAENNDNRLETVNPMYFGYANLTDGNLANQLQNEGKNASAQHNGSASTNALWAFADLDGDYVHEDGEDDFIAEIYDPSYAPEVMRLMRGIYIDTSTGQIMGTEGIATFNQGE
ncbi:prepilin-type N-terminal cleavage/methylation domain-containing protein [bacterium]|nr:prepilin-type N-terminal cleavage/methylation domain-containing protein [bacterium]